MHRKDTCWDSQAKVIKTVLKQRVTNYTMGSCKVKSSYDNRNSLNIHNVLVRLEEFARTSWMLKIWRRQFVQVVGKFTMRLCLYIDQCSSMDVGFLIVCLY